MTNNPTIDGVSREQIPKFRALGQMDQRSRKGGAEYVRLSDYDALQSRIDQLEAEAMYAAAGYQAARARIEELESGRGEPVLYQSRTRPLWRAADGERAWFSWEVCSAESFDEYRRSPIVNDWQYESRALFSVPPAPVAVVLPERKSDSDREWDSHYVAEVEGWNACLDATAALNGEKP